MTDAEMKIWLFERYTNLPEYFREEIADGSFNLRDCLFRLLLENEEQTATAKDRIESKWKSKIEGWTENALAVADNPKEREYMERCRARAHEIWGCLDDINSAL